MTGSSNSAPPVESARSCVLYDPDSGRILHIHQVVVLEGGETPTEAELESTARSMLDGHDARASKVAALHLGHADFRRRTAYTVDVATKALVERALPARRPSRGER